MIDTDEVVHGIVRYSSIDEDIGSRLYNRDLQDVLKRNGEKLDIVAWDACLMSMIETSYAMRDVSQILVGSQELEPGAGWNYEIVLDKLTSNPTMGPTELAKVIVDAYQAAYHGSLSTTMAATDLSKVGRLADSLSLLSDQLRADLVKKLSKTCAARSACHTYAPGYGLPYIDLGRFLEQIESQSDDPVERDRAKSARELLRDLVIARYAAPSRQGSYGSNGLSIYFPDSKSSFLEDPDSSGYLESNTVYPVEFVQNQRWVKFLNAYFDLVP